MLRNLTKTFLRSSAQCRTYATINYFDVPEGKMFGEIDRNKVKAVLEQSNSFKDRSLFFIDVREPTEIQMSGVLTHAGVSAINIPIGDLEKSLSLSEKEFEEVHEKAKPKKEVDILLFTCRAGVRSATGSQIAINMGYQNVANYLGGSLDWFRDA